MFKTLDQQTNTLHVLRLMSTTRKIKKKNKHRQHELNRFKTTQVINAVREFAGGNSCINKVD